MSSEAAEDGTRVRIIDLAEALMMERGFNAISYQDISDRIGIRKASVHYHFPSKADLGAAVIARYVAKLEAAIVPVESLRGEGFVAAFEGFLTMFATVAQGAKRVCLGGVLGAEFETLPEAIQREVQRFYMTAQSWLAELLEAGRADGAFRFQGRSDAAANALMAMMEGALIIARALGQPEQVEMSADHARRFLGLRV